MSTDPVSRKVQPGILLHPFRKVLDALARVIRPNDRMAPPRNLLSPVVIIEMKHAELKSAGLDMGDPTSETFVSSDGRRAYRAYRIGAITWSGGGSAHEVHGAIFACWDEYSRASHMNGYGYPLTDERKTADGVGRYNDFQHGSIYWTPRTGAHAVGMMLRDKWRSMDGEAGPLGYPVAETVNRVGTPATSFIHFERGSIGATEGGSAFALQGPIREKWVELLGAGMEIGIPVTEVLPTGDGKGRCCHFHRDAANGENSIYWSQATGAHAVRGPIRTAWIAEGAETGRLGYPVTEEYDAGSTPERVSDFQGGRIFRTFEGKTRVVLNVSQPAPPTGGQASPSRRTVPFILNADPIFEGVQSYAGTFPGVGTLSGVIDAINSPSHAVAFLKPGVPLTQWMNDGATVPVPAGGSLKGDELKLFTDPARKTVSVRAVSTQPVASQLFLTVTVTTPS